MLGFSQWLQFVPRSLVVPCLTVFDNLLLKGLNSFGGEDFGWDVGHGAFAHFKMLANRGDASEIIGRCESDQHLSACAVVFPEDENGDVL